MDAPRSLPLRGQAFPLSIRKYVRTATAKAPSADLDTRPDQPRDGGVDSAAQIPVRRPGDDAQTNARAVEHVRENCRRAGLPGRARKFRIPAAGLLSRNR